MVCDQQNLRVRRGASYHVATLSDIFASLLDHFILRLQKQRDLFQHKLYSTRHFLFQSRLVLYKSEFICIQGVPNKNAGIIESLPLKTDQDNYTSCT